MIKIKYFIINVNDYYGSGGTISNNNATDGVGGGISILGTRSDGYGTATMPSTFVMTGGNIVDNTAANYGGGIYYDSNSKIYLSGTISVQDNTAYCQSSDIKCTNNLNIISSRIAFVI